MSSHESEVKRILVAVDGSKNATRAVKVASDIAKNNNAALIILHVMTIPAAVYSGNVPIPFDKIEDEARREGEKFVEAAALIAEQKGVKPKNAIIERMDSPVRGITDYSEENKIDLIVVGTKGLGGFKRLLLGSVASGVVHYAHCSVLVVR
jgi:nucleotide-binding universal stress UspA family protein